MTDINVNALAEAINDKMDRDANNIESPKLPVFLVDVQYPTAENNYTWYRKYSDGWVEQGGIISGNGSYNKTTINLPVTMANTNYHTSCTIRWGVESTWYTSTNAAGSSAVTDIAGPVADITTTSFSIQSFSMHSWEVKGMYAQ